MSTIAEKLTYLAGTKSEIANAITKKGQSVSSSDTFRSYADKIRAISSEYNSGTKSVSENGTYNASDDGLDGYSSVTVNVSSGGSGSGSGSSESGSGVDPSATTITVEALNVTENGTYSEEGKAYSPVTVNVTGAAVGSEFGTPVSGKADGNIAAMDTIYYVKSDPVKVTGVNIPTLTSNDNSFGECAYTKDGSRFYVNKFDYDSKRWRIIKYEISGSTWTKKNAGDFDVTPEGDTNNVMLVPIVGSDLFIAHAYSNLHSNYSIVDGKTGNVLHHHSIDYSSSSLFSSTDEIRLDGNDILIPTYDRTSIEAIKIYILNMSTGNVSESGLIPTTYLFFHAIPVSKDKVYHIDSSGVVHEYSIGNGIATEKRSISAGLSATDGLNILYDNSKYLYASTYKYKGTMQTRRIDIEKWTSEDFNPIGGPGGNFSGIFDSTGSLALCNFKSGAYGYLYDSLENTVTQFINFSEAINYDGCTGISDAWVLVKGVPFTFQKSIKPANGFIHNVYPLGYAPNAIANGEIGIANILYKPS